MNGPHDLGGRMGFGPIAPERDEPLFHAAWEPRVLGLTLACGALGAWSIDESRHARESLAPADYLRFPYYRIWFEALGVLLARHGEIAPGEPAAGHAARPGIRTERRLPAGRVAEVLAAGGPTERAAGTPARFAVGDAVRTRNLHPAGHIRLPGYARDKAGRIERVIAPHVFPDSSATGDGEAPQWLYTVSFDAATLWGPNADAGGQVMIDAWESYLEPV